MKLLNKFKNIKKCLLNLYFIDKIIKEQNIKSFIVQSSLISERIGVNSYDDEKENIIVSLTSHGKRLHEVYLTIESLLLQTLKPNKILLWLNQDLFNDENIPNLLKKQISRGVEICYYETEFRSHSKLVNTLRKYPNDVIITVDDDVIYSFDLVESLYRGYLQNKEYIYYVRGHKILFKNRVVLPYIQWIHDYKSSEASLDILPTGVGGVLYPPGCFPNEVFNDKVFLQLTPFADDVWFRAMSLLNNVKCKQISNADLVKSNYVHIDGCQDVALSIINVVNSGNDPQIKAVFEKYGLYEKFSANNI